MTLDEALRIADAMASTEGHPCSVSEINEVVATLARAARPDDGLEAVFADIREEVAELRAMYPDHDDHPLALMLPLLASERDVAQEGSLLALVATVLHYAARRGAAL